MASLANRGRIATQNAFCPHHRGPSGKPSERVKTRNFNRKGSLARKLGDLEPYAISGVWLRAQVSFGTAAARKTCMPDNGSAEARVREYTWSTAASSTGW